eukprot:5189087-Amphidinium_carterae.2
MSATMLPRNVALSGVAVSKLAIAAAEQLQFEAAIQPAKGKWSSAALRPMKTGPLKAATVNQVNARAQSEVCQALVASNDISVSLRSHLLACGVTNGRVLDAIQIGVRE